MPALLLRLTDVDPTLLAVAIPLAVLASALLGYRIGKRRDRPVLGVLLGGLFTVPGLAAITLIPDKEPTYY